MSTYINLVNEGGEGYGVAEAKEAAWQAKCRKFMDDKEKEFNAKWTKEYTLEIKREWNRVTKETGLYAGKVKGTKCYGISDGELIRAVKMHNLVGVN